MPNNPTRLRTERGTSAPSKVKLWLSFGNVDKLALSIPLAECGTYAVNPLKWLRFLGFAIYGRQGYLSISKAGAEIDNYEANIEVRSYFFVSDGEPRLVDVDAVDDRTSDASYLTNLRGGFRESVVARDGTCVITNDIPINCIACHIMPHSKGSEYMSNLVHHREGTYEPVDNLNDINDTRNGLLLISLLHRPFGEGQLAFLKTPNFALTVDDIPYRKDYDPEERPASRLTLHYFAGLPELGPVIPNLAPPNSDARQPQDTSNWPPAIIVDLFYATAALKTWSPKSFIKYVRQRSRDNYYTGGDNAMAGTSNGLSHTQTGNQATGQSGSGRYYLRSRNKTSNIPTGQLTQRQRFADLMGGVSALWMQSAREAKPKLEGVCSSARDDGIKKWLQSMEDSVSQ